jgi:hypothetical protein
VKVFDQFITTPTCATNKPAEHFSGVKNIISESDRTIKMFGGRKTRCSVPKIAARGLWTVLASDCRGNANLDYQKIEQKIATRNPYCACGRPRRA